MNPAEPYRPVSVATSGAASATAVGTRRLTLDKEADFKGGDLKGVAVDSHGSVRTGLDLGAVPVAEAATIWAALPQKDGSVLLGTGNEGKLLKLQNGAVSVLAETSALAITSLANAWGAPTDPKRWGVLYVGTTKAFKGKEGRTPRVLGTKSPADTPLEGVIILDGNWKQAKTLWWRNPWLLRLTHSRRPIAGPGSR
jgi:hypothetical protein